MIKFGPSGGCARFAASGLKHTYQAAAWLAGQGVDCYEYSFGRGVHMTEATARKIGEAFAESGVELSVHAPYYINLAAAEEERLEGNFNFIFSSLRALRDMGGKLCVFHPGSPLKQSRESAVAVMMRNFERVLLEKDARGFGDLILCPETMGKVAQLGDLDEIIALCNLGDETIVPCIDWGHLNSRACGCFYTEDDYRRAIDHLIEGIGEYKTFHMHVHFSKIQYSDRGEVRHLTFEDTVYGPPYEPLMRVFADYGMEPYIVCESAGTQTDDALAMKRCYQACAAETAGK